VLWKKEQLCAKTPTGLAGEESFGELEEDSSDTTGLVADQQKILLFNCGELIDFKAGDAILPTRLTCYCRHHNEQTGFCVSFIVKDPLGTVIASALSPPIMITDDHKSAKARGLKRPRTESSPVQLVSQPFYLPQQEQERGLRRYNVPASPTSPPFPASDSAHAAHDHLVFDSHDYSQATHKMVSSANGVTIKEEPLNAAFDFSNDSYGQLREDDDEQGLGKDCCH